jgi:hypothetical protein
MLPEEIAIIHVPEHQQSGSPEAQGSNLADKDTKEAALHPELQMLHLTLIFQAPSMSPVFTPSVKVQLEKLGTSQSQEGKWLLPDARAVLSKPLMREIMTQLHQGRHWGTQAMCDAILRAYVCPRIYTLADQVTELFNLKKS